VIARVHAPDGDPAPLDHLEDLEDHVLVTLRVRALALGLAGSVLPSHSLALLGGQ
jgi:hypothetical protein